MGLLVFSGKCASTPEVERGPGDVPCGRPPTSTNYSGGPREGTANRNRPSERTAPRGEAGREAGGGSRIVTWLILPVVICLSQRLSHACLSISNYTVKLRMAH